jgi:hypothetical protein
MLWPITYHNLTSAFVYGMVMQNNQLVASSLKQQHEIRYAHQPSYLIAMMEEHEETNVSV